MTRRIGRLERQLCDIQGRLFERSLTKDMDSPDFIHKYMKSKTCEHVDMPYDRLHWAGEEYILEELSDESPVLSAGVRYCRDELYWIGYVYRYWHFLTCESSDDIYRQAPVELMWDCYPGFHTLDVQMAIDNLKELGRHQMGPSA